MALVLGFNKVSRNVCIILNNLEQSGARYGSHIWLFVSEL